MLPSGSAQRRILFVAEAPGQEEDRQGTQLVGKSGMKLRKELRLLKVKLDNCIKTNSIICRPPDNKITDLHIECCRPNLLKAIRKAKPNVIILLGGSAIKALMPTERDSGGGGVARWVGWTIPSHLHQAWICPTYHPSFLLRKEDAALELLFKQHLKAAIKLEKKKIPKSKSLGVLKDQIEIILSPNSARKRLKDLAKQKGILAFDYETTGIKPDKPKHRIVSCSFCLEGEGTFAFMVTPELHKWISRVLLSDKLAKVASNIKFEERWTCAKLGHGVTNWHWDTLQAAHILDNRKSISSVKFQAYIYFGIADYDQAVSDYFKSTNAGGFNRIDEIPTKDLLTYNGLDSLLEFMVMRRQRKLMGYD